MRIHRTMRLATAGLTAVLAAGLIQVPAAAAASAATTPDRAKVLMLWQTGGPQVHAGAERALVGSDADVTEFLTHGAPAASKVDQRIAVDRMLAVAGPTVKSAAQQALDATEENALGAFLADGWKQPSATDDRIRVDQALAAGGPQIRQAAQAALDNGSDDALRQFLNTGWQLPWQNDQRIRILQIVAGGGPAVKQAAQVALDAGTAEAYTLFLESELPVAQARDQETSSVAELAAVARDAGDEAGRETQQAKDAAARAVVEAELARQAAEAAARATQSAQGNAAEAAAAAGRAADAANRAADAAREAIGAANAASSAARGAAAAAARAATAASMAGQASARAQEAAAAAAGDASKASEARQAAATARQVASAASQAADAAQAAGDAAQRAGDAATAASSASGHAAAAAQAATDAGNYASAAGADASAARAAAAKARAQAARAGRAANAAQAFAAVAANAAFAAKTAAARAAQDAIDAANAADAAAEHAGQAANAAQEATDHANLASAAAQRATDAANQARQIYDAARRADGERVAVSVDLAEDAALAAADVTARQQYQVNWNAAQETRRDADTNRLIAEANAPSAAPAVVVADGRRVALRLATKGGPWSRSAALTALTGADAEVTAYIHSGLTAAAGQDDRETLQSVADAGTDGLRTAVADVLKRSDADVKAFLAAPVYPGLETDERVQVNQILSAARSSGASATASAAQRALDANTEEALHTFLARDQYTATGMDERMVADRLIANPASGPEVKGMAHAALDGPPALLHQFVQNGQYIALRHDQEDAEHDAEVLGYLAKAAQSAATATQNAAEAQQVAAVARGAADDAARYAQQAQDSANQAADYARQAHDSAVQAQASAQAAANSADTARRAADSAEKSARQAQRFALWAQASAGQAYGYAATAYGAARAAYDSAVAAGKDAAAAIQDAEAARQTALQKVNDERVALAYKMAQRCENAKPVGGQAAYNDCIRFAGATPEQQLGQMYNRGMFCQNMYPQGSQYYQNCVAEAVTPEFATEQFLELTQPLIEYLTAIAQRMVVMLAAVGCAASEICGALALSVVPEGSAFLPWLTMTGGGLVGGMVASRFVDVQAAFLDEQAAMAAVAQEVRYTQQLDEAARLQRLGMDPAHGWVYNPDEARIAVLLEQQLGIKLVRWPLPQGPEWIGTDGLTYDLIGPFDTTTFDARMAANSIKNSIEKHLTKKANMVPVDIQGLTNDQIVALFNLIEPYRPYVFFIE